MLQINEYLNDLSEVLGVQSLYERLTDLLGEQFIERLTRLLIRIGTADGKDLPP